MPKRTRKSAAGSPRAIVLLAAMALALFIGGEGFLMSRDETGQLFLARYLGLGDPARVTQLVGKRIRLGLDAVAVPRDSIRESIAEAGPAPLRWRVGLPASASLIQTNYAITKCLEDRGAMVLSGHEHAGRKGEAIVTLLVGLPGRTTHQIELVRSPPEKKALAEAPGRLAVVLFGFGEDVKTAEAFFSLPAPFAVAVAPGARWSSALFREARHKDREVVLYLPLEPVRFPQVSPGPGTILVSMKPPKITGTLRRYLEEAGPVAAVANNMGSLATQDMTVMKAVYQELKRQHLPFLHVLPVVGSVCKPLAADLGVEYDQPDEVIDAETRKDDAKALDAQWTRVLDAARRRGHMVVMLRATPLVERWLPGALSTRRLDGVSVVPLTSLIRRPAVL